MVKVAVVKKGRKLDGEISPGWWNCFRKLSLHEGDSFPLVRHQMANRAVFKSYFSLLAETLDRHDLRDKPSQIYNCDESGMSLDHKQPKTVMLKGMMKVRQSTSGNKIQITVLTCTSASRQVIPPMVVFWGKILIMH